MSGYLLLAGLLSGAIGVIMSLIEVRVVYKFIIDNQSISEVPTIKDLKDRNYINKKIKEFRTFIAKEKNTKESLVSIKKTLKIFKFASIFCTLLLFFFLAMSYFLGT